MKIGILEGEKKDLAESIVYLSVAAVFEAYSFFYLFFS